MLYLLYNINIKEVGILLLNELASHVMQVI